MRSRPDTSAQKTHPHCGPMRPAIARSSSASLQAAGAILKIWPVRQFSWRREQVTTSRARSWLLTAAGWLADGGVSFADPVIPKEVRDLRSLRLVSHLLLARYASEATADPSLSARGGRVRMTA